MRHATLEPGDRESAKERGGGELDSTSSLRLDKDPRCAQEVRDVRLYSRWPSARSADVSERAPHICTVLDGWRQGIAWQRSPVDACFRVFARCTKKKIFNYSLRSAVENGSLLLSLSLFIVGRSTDWWSTSRRPTKKENQTVFNDSNTRKEPLFSQLKVSCQRNHQAKKFVRLMIALA